MLEKNTFQAGILLQKTSWDYPPPLDPGAWPVVPWLPGQVPTKFLLHPEYWQCPLFLPSLTCDTIFEV